MCELMEKFDVKKMEEGREAGRMACAISAFDLY